MTPRTATFAALCAVASCGLAAPAAASEVLVLTPRGQVTVEDPYLPSRAESDLPAPPATAPQPERRAGAAQGRETVRGAIRRAFLAGQITEEQHDEYRRLYLEARSARRRLGGARRAQLHAVIVNLERIARDGRLSSGRMPALFLTLQRNTFVWTQRAFPASGARMTFARDPVVFQYYPGQGVQIQPLANFGKANALYNACVGENTRPGTSCRRGALRTLLDRLVELAARRGDFTAWEYYFRFGGGSPPWISGLAQGTAVQALARGWQLLQSAPPVDPGTGGITQPPAEPGPAPASYLDVALGALGAFEQAAPVGVRRPAEGGSHYLIYSFNRRLLVLNGFLQAVNGLFDLAQISGNERARSLFAAGDGAARIEVPRHDTGAWSLYALGGRESELGYHRLVRDFLRGACERTAAAVYCSAAERFTRYLLESPRIEFLAPRGPKRAGRDIQIRYRLSKISRVSLRVLRGSQTVYFRRFLSVPYGRRSFAWRPRSAGRYRLRLEAADLRNHHTVRFSYIRIR